MPNSLNQLPNTENELRKVIREEVRNELSTAKIDLIDAFTKVATDFKSEILNSVDKVMGELVKSRGEQTVLGHLSSRHENRIKTLEEIHNVQPTSF